MKGHKYRAGIAGLEVISALHASHERGSAWVDLPLTGADLDRVIRSG